MRDPQHVMGIGIGIGHEAADERAKAAIPQPEDRGNLTQEGILMRVIVAIGHGDVEKPLHQVDQDRIAGPEHAGDAARVKVIARHILPGEIEDPAGLRRVLGRDGEDLAEGGDLVAGDAAVGLGHLGAQRDHRDGEGDRAFRRRPQAVEDGRQPLALGQGGNGLGDAGPERHEPSLEAFHDRGNRLSPQRPGHGSAGLRRRGMIQPAFAGGAWFSRPSPAGLRAGPAPLSRGPGRRGSGR